MADLIHSYTAAGQFPWKLVRSRHAIADGVIRPVHLQFSPTNRCNGNCPWCSCAGVDRSLELEIDECSDILDHFKRLGTRAVTITGGGEPTLHEHLPEVLYHTCQGVMASALVTNGVRIVTDPSWARSFPWDYLTWIRVSVVDDIEPLRWLCSELPELDLAASFTVGESPSLKTARHLCRLAERTPNFTHVRFVHDILSPNAQTMGAVEAACQGITGKAIFQHRDHPTVGCSDCRISLLKPMVDADGYVYPCCGTQYATDELRVMPKAMRMCHWSEFGPDTPPFDGSICKRCYYGEYNRALRHLTMPLEHEEFV